MLHFSMLFGLHISSKLKYHLLIDFESYLLRSLTFIHDFNETSTVMNVTKGNLLNYMIEQILII